LPPQPSAPALSPELDRTVRFLRALLRRGPKSKAAIYAAASKAPWVDSTQLEAVANHLGVRRTGTDDEELWNVLEPRLNFIAGVELFSDDPADPVPEAIRYAYIEADTSRIYLAWELVGQRKLIRALDNPHRPQGIVPVCVNPADGTPCIALDWLEHALPEYASTWAPIRRQVERYRRCQGKGRE
jgi:hypothetical protein